MSDTLGDLQKQTADVITVTIDKTTSITLLYAIEHAKAIEALDPPLTSAKLHAGVAHRIKYQEDEL